MIRSLYHVSCADRQRPLRCIRRVGRGGWLAGWLALLTFAIPGIAEAQQNGTSANAELPKFFSLKSNPVNLRKGPGTQYPKVWVFRREGLPVEVLREHGRWRHVRDSDGATGWILRTLISQRRTALVTPWQLREKAESAAQLTTLRSGPRAGSGVVAKLEAGTLVSLKSCRRNWCHVSIGRFRGYVRQKQLWGVYPQEVLR